MLASFALVFAPRPPQGVVILYMTYAQEWLREWVVWDRIRAECNKVG